MPENQAVLFWGLNLGVLRILLFQGRAESPMERLAQGKRSDTLGWVVVSKTIYALKGQKRKNIKALCMRNKSTISTLLPFQGVNGFTNDNPTQGAASLALGYALHWAFSPPLEK